MQFETRVSGIPAICEVTYFEPGYVDPRRGHPDGWLPDDPPYMEYELMDSRGRPAPWLERKATTKDHERIFHEAIAQMGKH